MPQPTPHPLRLADEITRQLGQLADHLAQAPPREAAQILGKVLDGDKGVLGRVTALMITGAHFAKDHAQRGILPPEVWLALGRAANELHDVGLDLDEHADVISQLAKPPAPASTATPTPAASAMVVRRRR
ncbi:hypothetical protein SSP35_22_00610 [Streptomyces sp. NBRC 110611]|uniref:hypothetical protein n=1 Tax=Streptomyces sp. NBRC 110611 TaxID=1621259 RepID=UPI0008315524|nr:hypothetical protein [Streptomyces sp. NBRC 110611]GAU70758.1 hypothetical protein SSP35_22_00610 [Streptomyces sp. NBRC 110611]